MIIPASEFQLIMVFPESLSDSCGRPEIEGCALHRCNFPRRINPSSIRRHRTARYLQDHGY